MEIGKLVELERKRKEIQIQKRRFLKKQLNKQRLSKINLDNTSVKKGHIQKTKIIQKKIFETVVEKARRIPIEIQQNANVNCYLENNQNYQKIYQRTKKYIDFESEGNSEQKISQSVMALKAYADDNYEKVIHLRLYFQNEINCGPIIRPFQLQLPYKHKITNSNILRAIIIVEDSKKTEKCQNFQHLVNGTIQLKNLSQFIKQWKSNKNFKKQIIQKRILILCDWQIFKNSKTNRFLQGLLNQGYMVFPIDSKKVPFALQLRFKNYSQYINFMLEHQYALVKSGQQHSVHLKFKSVEETVENLKESVLQVVSKLIERNKNKGTCLNKAQIKSNTSIPFVIYQKMKKSTDNKSQVINR